MPSRKQNKIDFTKGRFYRFRLRTGNGHAEMRSVYATSQEFAEQKIWDFLLRYDYKLIMGTVYMLQYIDSISYADQYPDPDIRIIKFPTNPG